ncbi:hypothetical protein [Streptomyces sp. NPDC050848]|uniref:hypothetical protein n=1 Tax=Streptomyces sp. NPDC050848 TaxID=3155791 RepID=UPI0033CF5C8E
MSTPEVEELDDTFLLLLRYAGGGAAAQVAEALGPQARVGILRRRWNEPPEGLCDWVAEHGDGEEVAALLERWGLTRRQAALLAARSDLDPALTASAGDGQADVAAAKVEEQWLAGPNGRFENSGPLSAPLPEVERRVQARLGHDEQAWERALELLASGFTGGFPAFLDAAARRDAADAPRDAGAEDPGARIDPKKEVAWLIRLAPGDLPRRLLARIAPWPLHRIASGRDRVELAQPLIDSGDRKAWQSMFGGDYSLKSRNSDGEAEIERAFLLRDDPQINEWLLTELVSEARDKGYELAPAIRLALLEGRPFGPGAADPLPRTPAVHALVAALPPLRSLPSLPLSPQDADLLRLCFDSREPGLVAQALRASFVSEDVLLTPYQQLTAGIRMWESGRADELRALLAERGGGIRDEDVRKAFELALDRGSAEPLEAAATVLREQDDLLDEALSIWGLRLQSGVRPYQLGLFTRAELAAASRAITDDPSYRVDWDLVRSRLADPEMRHHRTRARERYGVLLAHADCPPDVVAALTAPELNGLDLLRLFADRDTAVSTLTRGDLGPGRSCAAVWAPLCETDPQAGRTPAVSAEDILRYARPVQGTLAFAPSEAVGRIVEEHFAQVATEDPAAEAGLWMALRRLTPYFSGPLPQLLRTAVRLSGGGAPLDVVPATDLLVGPERDAAADLVRERLGGSPGPWVNAVRLLAAGFDGTLPELLDAASAEPSFEPGGSTFLHGGPAALLGLAPVDVVDPVVGALDVPTRVVLARTSVSASTLRALVAHGDRQVWDVLLTAPRVRPPIEEPGSPDFSHRHDDIIVPALLAQDDPWLNARLVREEFNWGSREDAAMIGAVLAGRPFGPRELPVPVLPGLRADFADWTPDSGAELPRWTRNGHLYTSAEPVLAMQAMMTVRQDNYQDPPSTVLNVRQSLLAASTIAHAGRFDLLEYVFTHWHIRYPYGQCRDIQDLFGRAVRLRSAAELDAELSAAE